MAGRTKAGTGDAEGFSAGASPAEDFSIEGFSTARRWVILACFVFAAAVSIMSQLTMTTCLPAIIGEFGVDAASGQWLTTSYMLSLGVMVPCTGYLTSRFETRKLFLAGNLVFLVGLAGAFVTSFPGLIAVRFVQGLAAGLFIPLMQIVAFRLFPAGKRGFAMGVASVALSAGPVLGPVLAGVCTDLWGWRSVFVCVGVLTALSAASAPVVFCLRDEVHPQRLDVASAVLVFVGFSTVIGASASASALPVPAVVAAAVAGVVALVAFWRRQFAMPVPFLDLRPMLDRGFLLAVAVVAVAFGTLINAEVFISLYVQSVQGFSSIEAAMCLVPGSLLAALVSPWSGRMLDEHGPFGLTVAGLAFLAVGCTLAAFVQEGSPLWYSSVGFALRCLGNAFVLQNLQTWAVDRLPQGLVTHGTAIANTMRQAGGALVNALLFGLMGVLSSGLGEFGGIKVALGVSAVAVVLLVAAAAVHLRPRRAVS